MKKTITLLLILIIGIIGLFASMDESLYVVTTIHGINEMKITSSSTSPTWTANNQTGNIAASSSEFDTPETAAVVSTAITTAQTVGYLHTRTNNRMGIQVKVEASPLEYSIQIPIGPTVVDRINYTITGGENDFDTAIPLATPVTYLTIDSGTGLRLGDVKTIAVILEADAPNKTAGDYIGVIEFEYIIN